MSKDLLSHNHGHQIFIGQELVPIANFKQFSLPPDHE